MVLSFENSSVSTENNPINNMSSPFCPCSQTVSQKHFLLMVFSVVVMIVGILGNLIAIVVVQSSPLRRQTTYKFLTSLAVADLGVSLFVSSSKVGMYRNNGSFCQGFSLCMTLWMTDTLFPIASISHLLIICVDRWYAVSSPFTYVANMTECKARVTILVVWCYSFAWMLLGTFTWEKPLEIAIRIITVNRERYCYSYNMNYYSVVVIVIYVIPICLTTGFYMVVLNISLKQAVAISKGCVRRTSKWKQLSDEIKGVRTVGTVFLAYTFTWVPHMVTLIIQYWYPDIMYRFRWATPMRYDITTTIINNILPPINSCMNPFIYFVLVAQFRKALKDLLLKLLRRPRHCLYDSEERRESLKKRHSRRILMQLISTKGTGSRFEPPTFSVEI